MLVKNIPEGKDGGIINQRKNQLRKGKADVISRISPLLLSPHDVQDHNLSLGERGGQGFAGFCQLWSNQISPIPGKSHSWFPRRVFVPVSRIRGTTSSKAAQSRRGY